MKEVIMSNGSDGPHMYLFGVGDVRLSDFSVHNAKSVIGYVDRLYAQSQLGAAFTRVSMEEGFLERIISLAKKRREIQGEFEQTYSGIEEAKKQLEPVLAEYGMQIPELMRGRKGQPKITW